jgi:hypothetical protein
LSGSIRRIFAPSLAVVKSEIALPARQSARLAELEGDRDRLHSELQRLRRFDVMVAEAQGRLDQADGDLAALVGQERVALAEWATKGAHGPAPLLDHAARQAIEQRRSLALSDLAAAIRQQEAVQGRVAEINSALRQLGPEIFAAKLEKVLESVPEIERKIHDAHRVMEEQMISLHGLFDALCREKVAAESRHDDSNAASIQAALARIQAMREPEKTANWAARQASAASWRARLSG